MGKRTLCIPPTAPLLLLWFLSLLFLWLLIPLLFYSCIETGKLKFAPFKIVNLITLFVLLFSGISWPIHQMFNFEFSGYCTNLNVKQITAPTALGSYMISLVCICCWYLVRYIASFKDSEFSVSTLMSFILMMGILVQFIPVFLTISYLKSVWWAIAHEPANYLAIQQNLSITFSAFTITNLVYNIALLCLFLRRICVLKRKIKKEDVNKILQPSIVYALCLTLSVSSTFICLLFGIIRTHFIEDTNGVFMIRSTMMSWDILINALSINLQFKNPQKICNKYGKCCKCLMCNDIHMNNTSDTSTATVTQSTL